MKKNKKKNTIVWEKFENPYRPIEMDTGEDCECENEYNDAYLKDENKKQIQPVIMTPQGPVGVYMLTDEVMNFWIGHTTFRLTAPIMKLVEDTKGVESLEVYTPYRMRIGVGKLFQPKNVTSEIGHSINKLLYPSGSG